MAILEMTKEIKCIYQVLTSIGFKLEISVMIRVNNNVSIFMEENVQVSQRVKHVDVRYHILRGFIDDGF